MADQKWLVGDGLAIPNPDAFMEGYKEMERRLYWGPPLERKPSRYFCYIKVDGFEHNTLAMHEKSTDTMYKVGEGYEQLDEVWPKDCYTFDHYATSMEI